MYLISLGCNCEVADFLKANNLRHQSFPFDWIWSSIEFVMKTFFTDYLEFTEVEKLNIIKDPPHAGTYIFNNNCKGEKHRICTSVSVHDGDNLSLEEFRNIIPQVNAKYKRRFDRLYNILNSDTDVILIRLIKPSEQGAIENSPETGENIEKLYSLLINKFLANIRLCLIDKEDKIILNNNSEVLKFNSFDELKIFLRNTIYI